MTLKELSTILQDDIPINVYIKSPMVKVRTWREWKKILNEESFEMRVMTIDLKDRYLEVALAPPVNKGSSFIYHKKH